MPTAPASQRQRIYAVVQRIPRGRVATYGQVAELAGLGGHARQVGYALHALPAGASIPWHRVVNARGEVSPRAEPGSDYLQRDLLEREGIDFDERGCLDLETHRWRPRAQRAQPVQPAQAQRGRSGRADGRRRGKSRR